MALHVKRDEWIRQSEVVASDPVSTGCHINPAPKPCCRCIRQPNRGQKPLPVSRNWGLFRFLLSRPASLSRVSCLYHILTQVFAVRWRKWKSFRILAGLSILVIFFSWGALLYEYGIMVFLVWQRVDRLHVRGEVGDLSVWRAVCLCQSDTLSVFMAICLSIGTHILYNLTFYCLKFYLSSLNFLNFFQSNTNFFRWSSLNLVFQCLVNVIVFINGKHYECTLFLLRMQR